MKWIARLVAVLTFAVTESWGVGLIATDRWEWSQWLAWIPTQVTIAFIFIALVCSTIAKFKRLMYIFTAMLLATSAWFVFVENAFFIERNKIDGLRVVSWTMSHPKEKVSKESADKLIAYAGDITILTHGWHVRGEPSIKEWIGPNNRRVVSGPFTLLTKLPVLEARTLVASDGIYISMFTVDAIDLIGKEITVWAIDLPSTITMPRMETARRALRLLNSTEVQEPDIVLGDFNMTRNAYSIKTMFPHLTDASNSAGVGLLASFPASYPLYHIDHILHGESVACTSYQLVNPRIGRHCVQIAEFIP
jgi:endonuclease/exonuclease/phosphatase (EEP) superfamily protein YafD